MPKDLLTAAWKLLLLRGVIGIVLGIILVAWPQATIVVLMVLVGIWALIDGIGLAAQVFDKGAGTGQRVLFGVMALVALVVAMVAIFNPDKAASVITWLVGIWLLVRGLFELVGAFSSTVATPRWLLVLGALLDLVLGWLFVTHPGQSAKGVAVLIGILAIAWGVVFVVLALAARSATKDLPDDVSSLPPLTPPTASA
ncbi:MAG TPA: DUF308 domain-containing protein [Ornithinibacter sp.]|nr:DUF308 domain-containing protein [Ornithinibacter sp.]